MSHVVRSAVMVFFLVAAAAAQSGPDVYVSNIQSVGNYAPVGTVDAFSFGTTACNKGDQPLAWVSTTPRHPVIAQNLFRLRDGRFEQIGQSWLKHAFFAAQGNSCGLGCVPASGALGVGCSDVYGASTNGSQSRMGPRSDVDVHDGTFPYPPTQGSQGPMGTSIYKRCQAAASDLDPALNPGARYFVEVQFVAGDDAQAGHGDNNASWREVAFTPVGTSDYDVIFPPTSMTIPEEPAIMAWRAHDHTVVVQPVRVPGEGLIWIAFKRTDLGGGSYGWELAVQNLDSQRAVRALRVQLPAGATVSAPGFHDVGYHSGEPYSGTDWTMTIGAGEVAWETDTAATDPDANALRWGTLYNFRFVTDTPHPFRVQGEIETFLGPATVVPFAFDPPTVLAATRGDGQGGNVGQPFLEPTEVQVSIAGAPVAGIDVSFAVTAGDATVVDPGPITTDANGLASTAVVAGSSAGHIEVTASTASAELALALFARRFNVSYFPQTALLLMSYVGEVPGMPLAIAADTPQPPYATPFGIVCTSAANPGPDLQIASGIPGVGLFDPTIVTGPGGSWTRVITGAQGLAGLGDRDFQVYAFFLDAQARGRFVISNCARTTF